MSTKETKAIVERYWDEVWNKKNLAIADELIPDNVVIHTFGAVVEGREGWKQSTTPFFSGFPDLAMTVEFTIAEEDKVVVRWALSATHNGDFRGIAPTGRRISIAGVAIFRVAGGKIVEGWSQPDTLGLLQQLGAIPTPG